MSGRPKLIIYEYDQKGKFLQKYESMAEYREKYYSGHLGNLPLFLKKIKGIRYHIGPDGNMALDSRPGRMKILLMYKIHASEYCNIYNTENSKKPIEVFNLNGDKMAEFVNITIAKRMLKDFPIGTIESQVKKSKELISYYGDRELFFKYKNKEYDL